MAEETKNGRPQRVKRLKKIIVASLFFLLLVPVMLCIGMLFQIRSLNAQLERLSEEVDLIREQNEKDGAGKGALAAAGKKETIAAKEEDTPGDGENPESAKEDAASDGGPEACKVYLTFDDGPSRNTDRILDLLSQYGVKATFFVTGKEDEISRAAYQRIVAEGHTLGMHSYSHRYSEIYASEEAFREDLEKLQDYLYEQTGVWSRFYRFPGGSSNDVSKVDMQTLVDDLARQDIYYLDWNVESGDAGGISLSAKTLSNRVLSRIGAEPVQVVLFHDAADKDSTVEALSIILSALKDRDDVEILPVTEDMSFESVQHLKIGGVK